MAPARKSSKSRCRSLSRRRFTSARFSTNRSAGNSSRMGFCRMMRCRMIGTATSAPRPEVKDEEMSLRSGLGYV